MTKYSRKQKYEELRSRLQNDSESEIKSKELSGYEKRLNRINSDNFEEPDDYQAQDHDPIHARRRQYLDHAEESSNASAAEQVQPQAKPVMDSPSLRENENFTSAYDDSYLNDYINEVKQYNIDQGNAFSTNTDLNILKSLRGERPTPAAKKPFPNEVDAARQVKQAAEPEAPKLNTIPKRAARNMPENAPVLGSKPQGAPDSTIDIPFVKNDAIGSVPSDFVDTAAGSYDEPTQTMTKEDIAAEVQNLIRSQDPAQQGTVPAATASAAPAAADTGFHTPLDEHLEAERATRQQLLNETTQMRAQLDDYEDNLNDVSEKMQHTNKVLNFVLIVLIIAMLVVLAVVVYWILSSKGII